MKQPNNNKSWKLTLDIGNVFQLRKINPWYPECIPILKANWRKHIRSSLLTFSKLFHYVYTEATEHYY